MDTIAPTQIADVLNYIGGERRKSAAETLDVVNPATAETIARVPLSTAAEVDAAVEAAERVKTQWRRTPPGERVQHLFTLKHLLEDNIGELSRPVVMENGKTPAGNIGINIGVAAPIAYFPFSGWKSSFFGDLHAQGRDAIEFYTEKKVVIERWA